jgi:predicted  nucleic acid-binding Zn-ribbon protein
MKNNTLIKPLILSMLVLAPFSLLLYLIASSPEATVWSSIGLMIMGIFRTIQWLLALIVALALCLAFLFAIFFGAVALFDREASAKMFQGFQDSLPDWVPSLPEACCSSPAQSTGAATQDQYEALQSEISGVQNNLNSTIDQLSIRLEKLEGVSADNQQQLKEISSEMEDTVGSLSNVQATILALRNSTEHTARQLEDVSPEHILGNLPQRLQALEKEQAALEIPSPVDLSPLQEEIKTIQVQLGQIKEKADKALEAATTEPEEHAAASVVQEAPQTTPEQEEEEHRIFSYFDEQADKEKLVALVTSTLNKDMSYKQILNLLAKELGPKKGKIISSHPSLSKDYIRQCRKNRS